MPSISALKPTGAEHPFSTEAGADLSANLDRRVLVRVGYVGFSLRLYLHVYPTCTRLAGDIARVGDSEIIQPNHPNRKTKLADFTRPESAVSPYSRLALAT